ncbi:hypothetical protein FF100_21310 [Methylobacterium terricola]|uniref:Uncharacterized protein n=1 Tax=Methylobacterium terricola TaxID=2583531 RepID=A0A5C4LBW2_9HYPH|nr:hypothetical protein [Methylobacterium terricola]TNC10703.1 hypothetical protein FF100_21310 [Methylobacterium terricola]
MTRNVNVLYSKARVRKGELNHANLEQALRASLNTKIGGVVISTDASLRRSDAAPDYGILVINHADPLPKGIFIEIVRFAPGSQIPLIQTGAGGSEYSLQNANTPRGTELIRGFLYAIVIEDHFLYVNREMAVHRCEDLIEWMLANRTTIATPDLSLSFTAEVNVEALASVQKMVLRPREAADPGRDWRSQSREIVPMETRADTERLTGSSVFGILKAAHFTDERIATLEAQGGGHRA